MKKFTFLIMVLLTVISCDTQKNAGQGKGDMAGNSNFEIIKEDAYGGRELESHTVVTNKEELDALYRELNIEFARPIDFTKENVIALFMGRRNSGGYGVGIQKVTNKKDKVIVRRNYTEPESGSVSLAVITAPWCVAVIPKAGETVVE